MNNVIYVITRLEKNPGKLVTYREITADLETRGKFAGRKNKGIKEIKRREGGLKGKKKYIIVNRAVE